MLVNNGTNWDEFKIRLAEKIDLKPFFTTEQLDFEVEKIVSDIQKTAWDCTPTLKKTVKGISYPREIVFLIREKRKARKRWQMTRAPLDKKHWNFLANKLKFEIKKIKNDSFSSYIKELTCDRDTDYSLWKATKSIKRPVLQTSPIQGIAGKWARCNKEKAEAFAAHLASVFTPNEEADGNQIDNFSEIELISVIPPVKIREVQAVINKEIKTKKAPGYDLMTGQVLKQLPRKAIVKITMIINAALKLHYVPQVWKIAEVIMLPKPGKPLDQITSYRPISLLPVLSKLFEKLLLKKLLPIIEERKLVPNHQFGFRHKHSTIDQVHRITNIIEAALEQKKVCSAIFLDVSQAFDKVWHEGLKFKLRQWLPSCYARMLASYLTNRYFRIRQEDYHSDLQDINAGVPQGSVLGPLLYLLYTSDLPEVEKNTTATFADDTAVLAVADDNNESVSRLNKSLVEIHRWAKRWKIKMNETKSVHVDFTNKKVNYTQAFLDGKVIPYSNQAKYLGMTLDAKLKWKEHVKKKRKELDLRYQKMYWLIGRHSQLSTSNKLMVYKQVLKPVWTYGVQLWGCTANSNIKIVQTFQNKVLRSIVNAPWYIRNDNLHNDLKIESVASAIRKFAAKHSERLRSHVNPEAVHLLHVDNLVRRLKRKKPFELTLDV